MFGTWSGLNAADGKQLVINHLQSVAEATQWKKVKRLLKDVDTPVVVIASCKAIQALQTLGQVGTFMNLTHILEFVQGSQLPF